MFNSLTTEHLQHFGLLRGKNEKHEEIIEFNCLSPKIAMQEIAN